MKMLRFYSEKKQSSFYFIYVLLMCVFLNQVSYIAEINKENSFVSNSLNYLYYFNYFFIFISWIALLIKNKVKIDVIFLLIFLIFEIAIVLLFYPQNFTYVSKVIPFLIYSLTVYAIIRAKVISYEKIEKYIIIISRIIAGVILAQLFLILNMNTGSAYMNYSNAMTLVGTILLYSGVVSKVKGDLVLGLITSISVLIFGSRGAFLSLVIYFIILYLLYKNTPKKWIVTFIFLTFIGIIMLSYNSIIEKILVYLNSNGIESRTLSLLYNANLYKSQTRMQLYGYLLNVLGNNVFFGVGICGDRYYLPFSFTGSSATYAHNLFLELMLDYGLVLGTPIIILLMYYLIRYYIMNKTLGFKKKCFISIFFTVSFLELMISRSYLTEVNFFILMALIINCSEEKIKN